MGADVWDASHASPALPAHCVSLCFSSFAMLQLGHGVGGVWLSAHEEGEVAGRAERAFRGVLEGHLLCIAPCCWAG